MTRVLQLSDTHVVAEGRLAYGVVDTGAALERCVTHVRDLLPRIGPVDLVLVTGDLTDFGSPAEYVRFRDLVAPLHLPMLAVPGNHDDREAMRDALATSCRMPAAGRIDVAAGFDDLVVVGLDTTVDGRPHGHVAADSLDWLSGVLTDAGHRPVLVGLHHPPVDIGIGHMDVQKLDNPDALLAQLAGHRAPVTLVAGHVHRLTMRAIGGLSVVTAPSTAHAVAMDLRPGGPADLMLEPGGMLLHEVRDGRIVTHCLPIGPFEGPYPFFP